MALTGRHTCESMKIAFLEKPTSADRVHCSAPYKGLTRLHRLTYLAQHCPELRLPCSTAALNLIKESTGNTAEYHALLTIRNTNPNGSLLPASDRMEADSGWIQSTDARNAAEREKLELEMRNYQNNLIKESIRMAHRDLGDHFKAAGDLQEALKAYNKTRDYGSTTEHVVEMCLNVIEVSLRLGNWANVQTFVGKAEGVLESYVPSEPAGARKSAVASGVAPPSKGANTAGSDAIGALFRAGGSSSAQTSANSGATARFGDNAKQNASKRLIGETGAKLKAANALAYLGQGRYEVAARYFSQLDQEYANSLGEIVSPSDVSIYVALCSLATMDRPTLKAQVMDNANYRAYLEYEPHAKELLDAFFSAQFKRMGEILDAHQSRYILDAYLAPHASMLRTTLTRRALKQFFSPFDRISIARMADAFGWQEARMADELVACIRRGEFKAQLGKEGLTQDARLNWSEMVLEHQSKDPRQHLFHSALKLGDDRIKESKRLLLRMKLVENGLVSKIPRSEA